MDDREFKILCLRTKLEQTDYITLKYTEGEISEEEFQIAKVQRAQWREEIRRLEELLKSAKSK